MAKKRGSGRFGEMASERTRANASLMGEKLPPKRRTGPSRGRARSWREDRSGVLGFTELGGFIQDKIRKKDIPGKTKLEHFSASAKAAWISEAFKRSNKQNFAPGIVERVILPAVLKNTLKFASGLGLNESWFFKGIGPHAETFFKKLFEEGKFTKFAKGIYHRESISSCDPKSLGKGIAENLSLFLEGLGPKGRQQFFHELKRTKKASFFLSGIESVIGRKDERYQLAKKLSDAA